MRPRERQWDEWVDGQKRKIARALDVLNLEAARLGDAPDIGNVAVACALGYLDLRYPEDRWRDGRGELAEWFSEFARRDSFRETAPPV